MPYEIQQFTLCDGWINNWIIHHPDGSREPETFATEAEATAALNEFLAEVAQEIAAGQRGEDEDYCEEEFQIVKVGEK